MATSDRSTPEFSDSQPADSPDEQHRSISRFSDTHSPRPFTLNGDTTHRNDQLHETTSLPILNRNTGAYRLRMNHTLSTDDSVKAKTHVTFNVQSSEDEDEEESRDTFEATKHYANVTLYGSDTEDENVDNSHSNNNNNVPNHFPRKRQSSMNSSKRSRSSRRFSVMDFRRDRSASRGNLDRRQSSIGMVCIEDVPEKDLEWLESDGFLERLESEVEEIDADILQKGVNELRAEKPATCRRHMVDVLTGRAFTFVVLVVALLDAVAIITQIILDIQANHLRARYVEERDKHLVKLLVDLNQPPFNEMNVTDAEDLVYLLTKKLGTADSTKRTKRKRRSLIDDEPSWSTDLEQRSLWSIDLEERSLKNVDRRKVSNSEDYRNRERSKNKKRNQLNILQNEIIDKLARRVILGDDVRWKFDDEEESIILHRFRRAAASEEDKYPDLYVPYKSLKEDYQKLGRMSHYLHYASIGLLSFLVAEVILKFIGFGSEFFKHKIEVTDAIVVTTSFVLDLVFINEHEKNIPVVIFLFIWQMIRVISALIVQNKKRVEFLLRVLGELNKTLSEQIEQLKEDIDEEKKRSVGLFELCHDLGGTEEMINDKLETEVKPEDMIPAKNKTLFTSPIAGIKNMLHASKEALGIGRKTTPNPSPSHQKKDKRKKEKHDNEVVLTALAFRSSMHDPNHLGVDISEQYNFCNGGPGRHSAYSATTNSELDSRSSGSLEGSLPGSEHSGQKDDNVDSGIVNEAYVVEAEIPKVELDKSPANDGSGCQETC